MEKALSYIPLNWDLMKNPANWIIIFLMVALASAGLALIISTISAGPADNGEIGE